MGLLGSRPPNIELAVFELTKAVIRMETVVNHLIEKTYGPSPALLGADPEKQRQLQELFQVREDILSALNAITGQQHGG
ncbi:hypothetical protein M5E06_10450 [Azospirillum sp. A1-3]|uniref:hypothetical protein n=1 Tax=Azospirillum sp. A1-3 TaxID=185874 RepID=UPI002077876E|nr:hypothetical protein [Azospirillum sp. A1-3]MCM8734614.1 hypothetical protein [Azospirillum sp. A1-3]